MHKQPPKPTLWQALQLPQPSQLPKAAAARAAVGPWHRHPQRRQLLLVGLQLARQRQHLTLQPPHQVVEALLGCNAW